MLNQLFDTLVEDEMNHVAGGTVIISASAFPQTPSHTNVSPGEAVRILNGLGGANEGTMDEPQWAIDAFGPSA